MSYSLNSLKRGVIQGIVSGSTRGVSEGDTRGLDYSSFVYIIHTYKFAPYLVGNFEIWMFGLVVGWLVKYKCDPDEVLES